MSQCPECGTVAVRDGQRFCARCGTDLDAGTVAVEPPAVYGRSPRVTGPLFADDAPPTFATPPAAPPPPPHPVHAQPVHAQPVHAQPVHAQPAPYDGGSGRRRTPLLLLAIAAVLAALLGAGGVVLLLDGNDESPSGTTAEDRRDDVDTTDSVATPTATPTESRTTEQQQTFRCWDGGAVASLGSCSRPSGVDGMAWVFPSSSGTSCFTDAGVQRVTEADCAPTVAGETVRIHYSEWRSRTALEGYYGGLTLATISPPDGRDDLTARQVVSRDSDVGYKVAIYYTSTSGLWSVTVYAADEAQYLAALDELEIRPFGQLQGRRS